MRRTAFFLSLVALVQSSPSPQAVTSAISPTDAALPGCSAFFSGMFGIAVLSVPASKPTVESSPWASPGTVSASAPVTTDLSVRQTRFSAVAISQISDGQIQAATSADIVPPTSNSQTQRETSSKQSSATLTPIAQISDGQIQHHTSLPLSRSEKARKPKTMKPLNQISDGQIQATTYPITHTLAAASVDVASHISDGQSQAPTATSFVTSVRMSTASVVARSSPLSTQSSSHFNSSTETTAIGCKSSNTLEVSLRGGLLLDSQERTGYIANNFQVQFDKPAQAGAIYTAGWSVCSNGSLALGGSSVFWQCLSGDFYNLYDRNFGAGQCAPIILQTVQLQDC